MTDLLLADPAKLVGALHSAYARDGFSSQYTTQSLAWAEAVPLLQRELRHVVESREDARSWTVLLEYPLYRLRRRIDVVLLAGSAIVVIEMKVGERRFHSVDRRQVEEYSLDLRDFHAESGSRPILPVLWATDAPHDAAGAPAFLSGEDAGVFPVAAVGADGLSALLCALAGGVDPLDGTAWDTAPYRPVPNVVDAATSIFAGHDVREIGKADADNLASAAARLVERVVQARTEGKRFLLFLTGVPGSGKTLAGLQVVHDAVASGAERSGDIVYLSGNTPLVTVLREALARDEHHRRRRVGQPGKLDDVRREVRTRIQHISDFLRDNLNRDASAPPHEHVVVFDEAQRAWDEAQGKKQFDRTMSEPALLLDLMSRHRDWCGFICLVGGGQEINSGEEGIRGWGDALRKMDPREAEQWTVVAPPDVIHGGDSTGGLSLGEVPHHVPVVTDAALQLTVPQRSYRSPAVSAWVNHVLEGNAEAAAAEARRLASYPVAVTRSQAVMKRWLQAKGRGMRRYGLLASSSARRLRAEGVAPTLNAAAGTEIAHWYLNGHGDIRASFALEVPANEYTAQGLELDFAGICWGGDLTWSAEGEAWRFARLSGTAWQVVRDEVRRRFLTNSYRVLLTRAREGIVLWVPRGDPSDPTRSPEPLDETAAFLVRCGATALNG